MTVLAACQQAATPAPTTAPAAGAPAAAPTSAPAAAPTTAPAAAATAAPAAAGATVAPTAPAAVAVPTFTKAKINGKLSVIQSRDFYAGHNAFIEAQIRQFASTQDYPLDHSYIDAYAGAGNVVEKLTAAVQAGDAPDVLIHNLGSSQLHFLDIIEDVDALEQTFQQFHGKAAPAFAKQHQLEGKWWGIPHFSRSGGYWVRMSAYKAAGVDPFNDLGDFQKLRDAAVKTSKPDQQIWGWGMTANRSGDGDTTVRNAVFDWGGQITDESGQIVVLNTEPYRSYAIAGLNFIKEIYTSPQYAGILPPGVGGWTDPSNNEALLAGRIAMTNNAGTVFAQGVQDKNPVADDLYLITQPGGVGPAARALTGAGNPMCFFIMKGAKNREAAEQLITSLMTADVYKQMFKISTGYVYPAHEWGWDQPEITQNEYSKHVTAVWQKLAQDPSGWWGNLGWPGPPTPQADALENSNFWTDMFGSILGGTSVEDAIKAASDHAVQTFQDFGAKGA
jgi:multiple sugar transport system substrate-binding protein